VMGYPGNHVRAADGANYTLLMQEFRKQLDAYGATVGKRFLLTGAMPAGGDKISQFQIAQLPKFMDWIDVMTYDMHGTWESTTNFQSPLYGSPSDPSNAQGYNVDNAISLWTQGGFPARHVMMGIPYYARGWTGVPNGGKNGLYQTSSGPSPAFSKSQAPGLVYWKELVAAGKTGSFFTDPVTKSYWIYDGTSFYTLDPPASIAIKDQYVKQKRLGGVMMFSLLDDDPNASLVKAVSSGL
jgi:chitinase